MFQSGHKIGEHHEQESPLILIAEDDPTQRLILKTVLEKEGCCVHEAANGKEALAIYNQHHFQMVLLDAVMPQMDGFETCRQIRALDGGRDTLVLMITVLHDDQSVKHSFEVGADDFITKPVFWSVLTGRVMYLLKAKVAERQLKQAEDQLIHAQKLEVVGNLTEGISHHFNNLLTSIIGYTEMLLAGSAKDDEAKQNKYLQEVHSASKRACDLIAQMQAFTDGGKSEPELLVLQALLEKVMGVLGPTLPSNIELHHEMDKNLPLVKIDTVQFQQLMINMLINARDAMENTGDLYIKLKQVTISNVRCASCHQLFDGDYLELMIKDTGNGIEGDKIKRIFEPYFTTRPVGQGSGMGLSVVHGIMHDHDGHIQVETEPGRGTVFKLLFPVTDAQQVVVEEIADETETISQITYGARILVVDDEESVGEFEMECLTIQGYQVTYIGDPEEAISTVTKNPEMYDLVITCKIMPHIDGLELASTVTEVRADLPVILCTDNTSLLSGTNLECMGIRGLLSKPMEVKKLLATVKRVLSEARNDKV